VDSRINGSRWATDRIQHTIRRLREKIDAGAIRLRASVTVSTVNRWEMGHAAPSNLAWRAIGELAAKPRMRSAMN
jgi:DNA-binding transcriptional regulator YiaG